MLSKKKRINHHLFEEVFSLGKKVDDKNLDTKKKENKLPYCRYAVVVPKKILKKATERNRARRIFYGQIELVEKTCSGYDIIFILRKKLNKEDIASAIKKAHK